MKKTRDLEEKEKKDHKDKKCFVPVPKLLKSLNMKRVHQVLNLFFRLKNIFLTLLFQISLGGSHAVCVTKDGVCYTWGSSEQGQCGHGLIEV